MKIELSHESLHEEPIKMALCIITLPLPDEPIKSPEKTIKNHL
jgi:hypothetical protein